MSIVLLVETFFAETANAFHPLVSSPNGRWHSQLRHATSKGLEFTTPDRIDGAFFAPNA